MKRRFKPEPRRCTCEPGPNAAQQHGKLHAKAADHGDPYKRRGGCQHSELQLTTRPVRAPNAVPRLRM